MPKFYDLVQALDEKKKNIVLTRLDGDGIGKKAICSDGEWIESEPSDEGFILGGLDAKHLLEKLEALEKSAVVSVDGAEIFADRIGREPKLIICGAGHVSIPVIRIGRMIGFHVTVLEDRKGFAQRAKEAGAHRVICRPFAEAFSEISGDVDTYFVIVTRGHQYDQICLRQSLEKPHAYIGMMGSRRRVGIIRENLIAEGVEKERLDAVHSPIGLKIGAQTPEEIAVSIAAELIDVRRARGVLAGYPEGMLEELCSGSCEKAVLATIISRSGSAPQGEGAKMLIRRDGTCLGTIGGGYMEAIVAREASDLMESESEMARICHARLDNPSAGEEGMVCGGRLRVLLEKIESIPETEKHMENTDLGKEG